MKYPLLIAVKLRQLYHGRGNYYFDIVVAIRYINFSLCDFNNIFLLCDT